VALYPAIDYKTTGFGRQTPRILVGSQEAKVGRSSVLRPFSAIGVLVTLMTTPLYTATVRLRFDRNVAKVVAGGNVTPLEGTDFEFMKTQYELLMGRTIGERVVSAPSWERLGFIKGRGSSSRCIRELFASNDGGQASINRENGGVQRCNGQSDSSGLSPVRAWWISATRIRILHARNDCHRSGRCLHQLQSGQEISGTILCQDVSEIRPAQLKLRLEECEKVLLEFARRSKIARLRKNQNIAESEFALATHAAVRCID